MHQVHKLTAQIRALLGGSPPLLSVESLAAEYARWREEAERRLAACAAMLAKGSEHTALEMAEIEPPLLDLVAALSFAEEPDWTSLCASHGLSTGPLLDARTISALDAVYAKGLSPNSPLYHEYRAAATARDDVKALQIIRTISRVNPSDTNAQSELERLLNKHMHLKLDALRSTLGAGDDGATADLVDELETFVAADKLAKQPDFIRGLSVRKSVRLASATRELPGLLEELERLQQAGDWQTAAERLHALEQQREDTGLVLDGTQSARCETVRRFVEAGHADALEHSRFLQAAEKLRAYGEEAATRSAGTGTLELKEALELESKFDQLEHEVKQFGRVVPEPPAGSIRASGRAVRGAAGRIRRRLLLKRVAAVALVLAVVGAGLAWFGRAALVKSYSEKLATLQRGGQALAAQELLEKVKGANLLGIHSAPDLQAAVAETGRWVAGQEELRLQADAQVTLLEKERIPEADPVALQEKYKGVEKLVGGLASDMSPPLAARLAVMKQGMEAHFARLRGEREPALRAALAEAQAKLAPVTFDMPASEVAAVLEQVRPLVESVEQQTQHPSPTLRPAADIVEAFESVSAKWLDFNAALGAISSFHGEMAAAGTLESYGTALKSLADVPFREVALALPVLKAFPTADIVAARLLMDGDISDWKAVRADRGSGASMRPRDVRQEEISILLALRDDPNLVDVWQWTLVSGGSTRNGWSQRKPRDYVVGGEKRYEGMMWDPTEKDLTPIFRPVKLTSSGGAVNVSGVSLSGASQLLAALKLEQMTNAAGDQWSLSLLESLSEIAKSRVGAVLPRAILMQHLGALTALRPHEWGRHYCPSLRRDLAKLESICGRRLSTYEWMLPSTVAALGPKLTEFFQELSDRDYLVEARRFREVALAVRDVGVHYAGFVDAGGRAHVIAEARPATELWCATPEKMILLKVETGAPNSGLGTQVKNCPVYAPLFHIPADRAALLRPLSGAYDSAPFLKPL